MWEFDEDDYQARVLGPAVSRFAEDARLPNFFARYALPADISDEADIDKAVRTVTAFWYKRRLDAPGEQLLAALLQAGEQEAARRVLLDSTARRALRAAVSADSGPAPAGGSAAVDAQDRGGAAGAWSLADEPSEALLFGARAVAGTQPRYGAIADVHECVVQDFDSYVLLRWGWPALCNQVTLAWRSHGFPTAPNDPHATCRRVTRAEYDRQGGIQLERLAASAHYFAVFAMGHSDGELTFASGTSPGARCVLHRWPPAVVSYTIKRPWLRRGRIRLELSTDVVIEALPPLVLLAKPGKFQPIDPKDGTVLAELAWYRLAPDEPIHSEVDLPPLRTSMYLRAFFVRLPNDRRYRLVDPPCEQLKILKP